MLSESLKKATTISNIDFDKIVSPVGQYIRNNPVPPIVRQIRPKATRHFDDDLAAFEREEELLRKTPNTKTPNSEKKRMFKPLPMAEYRSSKVAIEQQMPSSGAGKSLSKAFGITPTVEAKVSILLKYLDFCTEWYGNCLNNRFIFRSMAPLYPPGWV